MFSLHIDTARTWRGGQNQVLLTVTGLRARGHRTVLVAHPEGELARRASEGHDLIRLAPAHEIDFAAAFKLSRMLRELKPDIVHAHDPHGVAMTAMALALFGRGETRPAVIAARRVDFHLKQNSLSRWKYKQVDMVICASAAIRAMVVEDGLPDTRVVTVHEGVDLDRLLAIAPVDVHKALWLPAGAPVVGNIAALVPHKGQRYLVDAASGVVRAVRETQSLIFGEGELRHALTRQIKDLGLEHNVRLIGFRPDVISLLKSLDVFVMSSTSEGLGTSILDAMAASRVVVATTAGGIPEIVEHEVTGLLVAAQRAAPLAEAIIRLLENPDERARMGHAGLARVRERFTADQMVDATLAVYHCVAGTPHVADNGSQPPSA